MPISFHAAVAATALTALLASPTAEAAAVPFVTDYAGSADIVEVIDPNGPIVRFVTAMSGSGVFGLGAYESTDIVDLSTGAGSGTQRFITDSGDLLFGAFTVQITPTETTGVLGLLGHTTFTGGTGLFEGATGSATFTGVGSFISTTSALTAFHFDGRLNLVPEPACWALLLAGLWAACQRGRKSAPAMPTTECFA